MALSFSKMFKNADSKSNDKKTVQKQNTNEIEVPEEKAKEAKKHGEQGVCCGSCT